MPEITARLSTALADRYKIESHLGEGGMANVYLAEDLKHDRPVAVKVLRPELAAVLGADRFIQEIKTTANLQHPHILPLHDSRDADGFLYYVMPFIDCASGRRNPTAPALHCERRLPPTGRETYGNESRTVSTVNYRDIMRPIGNGLPEPAETSGWCGCRAGSAPSY